MQKEINFFIYAVGKNLQNVSGLRANFITNIFGMVINNFAFIAIWIYFAKAIGPIGGWTAYDIIGLHGFASLCFGLVFSFLGGIFFMAEHLRSGNFDRILLSPKNLLVRLSSTKFDEAALGDVLFGICAIILFLFFIKANLLQVFLSVLFCILTTMVFLAMSILAHSATFFFSNNSRIERSIFEVFFTPALMHGGAFQGPMRYIFIYIVPSLAIATLPVESIKNISIEKFFLVLILAIVWFSISIKVFYKAVKYYESSNFINFG